jgi:hypothetical protein
VTIDVATAVAKSITFTAPDAPNASTGETSVTIEVAGKLTLPDAAPITLKHDAKISGEGIIEGTTVSSATIDVEEDKALTVEVTINGGTSYATLVKTGKGTLTLSGGTSGAITAISHTAAGRLVVKDEAPAVTITLGDIATADNILDLGGELVLDRAALPRIASTSGSAKSVINVLEGADVTLKDGAFNFSAFKGTVNVAGTLNFKYDANELDGATVKVAKTGALNIDSPNVTLAKLNAEGPVNLNIGIAEAFTLTDDSEISGNINGKGNGVLTLNPGATSVIKLRGNNSYAKTEIGGATGGTVEILNEKSLGDKPVEFKTGDGQILKVADDAASFSLRSDITATEDAKIEVPAGITLTLRGALDTDSGKITKTGDGVLDLNGHVASGTNGFDVDAGTLILSYSDAARDNEITVKAGATLKPGCSGITHKGDLTFAAQSVLSTLTEANASGPLLSVDGAFSATGLIRVITNYQGGTWAKDTKLHVVKYLTASANANVTPASARAYDAARNTLDTTVTIERSGAYSILSIAPKKDCVFPVIEKPDAKEVKSADKTFDLVVTVTSETGVDQTATKARFVKSGLGDLVAKVGNGIVTISGAIPADDGTYYIELIATAEGGYASKAEDIKLVVKAAPGEDEDVDVTSYAWSWTGLKKSISAADATKFSGKLSLVEKHTVTEPLSRTLPLTSVQLTLTAGTTVLYAGEPFTATDGTVDFEFAPLDGATTFAVGDYKIVVASSDPAAPVDVTEKEYSFVVSTDDEKEPGNGGGGCDAGFGLFGLLAATGAVALLRRKG